MSHDLETSLKTLIYQLNSPGRAQDGPRLLNYAVTLLTGLSHPANISLLVSCLLTAPAVWNSNHEIDTSAQLFDLFRSAWDTIRLAKLNASPGILVTSLSNADWVTAVVKGADERSPRWRHSIVLAGLAAGIGPGSASGLPHALVDNLRIGIVIATNAALEELYQPTNSPPPLHVMCMMLANALDVLEPFQLDQIDHQRLLPTLIDTLFFSPNGLHRGYILAAIDRDVKQVRDNKFEWAATSDTFHDVQGLLANPFIRGLGPISRLTSVSLAYVHDIWIFAAAVTAASDFARSLARNWRLNKLSELDPSEESLYLNDSTLAHTMPALTQILRSACYSTITVCQGAAKVLMTELSMPQKEARQAANGILSSLRDLYFASRRLGLAETEAHALPYAIALDVIASEPLAAKTLVEDIVPRPPEQIPVHPQDRALSLFFLNTAEQLAQSLSAAVCETLILPAAAPYTAITTSPAAADRNPHLRDLFEAAHATTIAVLCAPHCASAAIRGLPMYAHALLDAFPSRISPRQLRLAVTALVSAAASPGPIAVNLPVLAPALLEMLLLRAQNADLAPLPASDGAGGSGGSEGLSPQAALVLAVIDALPRLSVQDLEVEWLDRCAEALTFVADPRLRAKCATRFWEVLSGGEMDVPRAAASVAWWDTRGGRMMVQRALNNDNSMAQDEMARPLMSGALPDPRRGPTL